MRRVIISVVITVFFSFAAIPGAQAEFKANNFSLIDALAHNYELKAVDGVNGWLFFQKGTELVICPTSVLGDIKKKSCSIFAADK